MLGVYLLRIVLAFYRIVYASDVLSELLVLLWYSSSFRPFLNICSANSCTCDPVFKASALYSRRPSMSFFRNSYGLCAAYRENESLSFFWK